MLFGGTQRHLHGLDSNKAELFLNGDEDDDTFTVRAFVKVNLNDPKAPLRTSTAEPGRGLYSLHRQRPVRIDSGDNFDTLTVIGTEFGDDFVINDQGVCGADLFVTPPAWEDRRRRHRGQRPLLHSSTSASGDGSGGAAPAATPSTSAATAPPVTVVSNKLEWAQRPGGADHHHQRSRPTKAVFVPDVVADVRDNGSADVVVTLDRGPIRVRAATTMPMAT